MSPIQSEAPSTRRLLTATAVAIVVAGVILVTTVLPAEYGIDPTGIGSRLGLDVLAGTAEAGELPATAPPAAATSATEAELDAVGQPAQPVEAGPVSKREVAYHSDTMSLVLPPGKGAEIKAAMKSGDGMVFHWSASGDVAVDMHGERTGAANDEYTSYWIERSQRQASGTFNAPFDGSHGWYWLNRSNEPVTVRVEVTGFQEKLYRPGQQ
ncbi:MAG: hypothetical protein M3414_08860 [Pseudomonadota bacterium]|nr:hypothetical protein [Pseudomonadota bacterium]